MGIFTKKTKTIIWINIKQLLMDWMRDELKQAMDLGKTNFNKLPVSSIHFAEADIRAFDEMLVNHDSLEAWLTRMADIFYCYHDESVLAKVEPERELMRLAIQRYVRRALILTNGSGTTNKINGGQ